MGRPVLYGPHDSHGSRTDSGLLSVMRIKWHSVTFHHGGLPSPPSLALGFRGLARRFVYTVHNPVHLPMSQRRIWRISVWVVKAWVAYRLLIASLSLGQSSSF